MVLLRHARPQGGLLIGTLGPYLRSATRTTRDHSRRRVGSAVRPAEPCRWCWRSSLGFTGGLDAQMPLATGRLEQLGGLLRARRLASAVRSPQPDGSPGSGFLGWLPLFGGAIGLWRARHVPWATPLMLAGLLCLVLAMGPTFALTRGFRVDLPMPADLFGFLPGLSQMGTTLRFASGLAFRPSDRSRAAGGSLKGADACRVVHGVRGC